MLPAKVKRHHTELNKSTADGIAQEIISQCNAMMIDTRAALALQKCAGGASRLGVDWREVGMLHRSVWRLYGAAYKAKKKLSIHDPNVTEQAMRPQRKSGTKN